MYEELIKALRFCAEKSNGWNCPACPGFDGLCSTGKEIRATAADAIREQTAQLSAKDYTIMGIMHAVDKWLDGDELKQDEVNRAATMREKMLRIIEGKDTVLARVTAEKNDLRNELCQQCGKYRMAHQGACEGCRWLKKQGEK